MGKGCRCGRESLGARSQGLSLTTYPRGTRESPPGPQVILATCEVFASPHCLAHILARSGSETLAKSETTLLSRALSKFEDVFNLTKENKTLSGPGVAGFFGFGFGGFFWGGGSWGGRVTLTDAFQTLIGMKLLTHGLKSSLCTWGQKPCHLGASREQLQTKNSPVPVRCLAAEAPGAGKKQTRARPRGQPRP